MKIGRTGKNDTAKVISILLALFLWFIVTTKSEYSYIIELPINYLGPSEGFVLASSKPDHVKLNISGTGQDLFVYSLLNLFKPDKRFVLVTLRGLPRGTSLITIEESDIVLGDDNELQIEGILFPDNANFQIEIDREIKRSVEVGVNRLTGYIIDDDNVISEDFIADPKEVEVTGPEEIVTHLTSVKVSNLSGKKLSPKDSLLTVELTVPEYSSIQPERVSIRFRVEPIETKMFMDIPLTLEGFPVRNRPVFTPDTLSVQVKGPRSVVTGMTSEDIIVMIPYSKFRESSAQGDSLVKPNFNSPNSITDVIIFPEEIHFNSGSK